MHHSAYPIIAADGEISVSGLLDIQAFLDIKLGRPGEQGGFRFDGFLQAIGSLRAHFDSMALQCPANLTQPTYELARTPTGSLALGTPKPSTEKAPQTVYPDECYKLHVGEWGGWDECKPACGPSTQERQRDVACLPPAPSADSDMRKCHANGHASVPHTDRRACVSFGAAECRRGGCAWHASDWTPWSDRRGCGVVNISRTRSVHCLEVCSAASESA
jgi:hypothetical protein